MTKANQLISDAVDQDGTPDGVERCLHLDVSRYQAALDDRMLSVKQKREFLETIWLILSTFAELGYRVQSVDECNQNSTPSPQHTKSVFDQALDKISARS